MEAVMARTYEVRLFDPRSGVFGCHTAAFRVKPEMRDKIGAGVVFRRLQNVVLKARDMRHESKAVGRIGRDRVRTVCRVMSLKHGAANGAIRSQRMNRGITALVIGR